MGRGSRHGIHRDEWEQRRTEFVNRGDALIHSKLTSDDVTEIRSIAIQRERLRSHIKANLSNAAVAKRFSVSERAIERVLSRQTWSHT